jgi:hypothetical protein
MSKLSDFLATKKLDARRILIASEELEKLRPEDRALRLARRTRKEGEAKPAAGTNKPRSGRPVTQRAINAALEGKPLSGPQKTRILKAVNRVLEQKKQEAVQLKTLF